MRWMARRPVKHCVCMMLKNKILEGNALEQAVANADFPQEDLRGSVAYKRYRGILVADLYADCQQAGEEAVCSSTLL
ncbi:hypothetical protein ACVXHB_10215 [Escherichia coli]